MFSELDKRRKIIVFAGVLLGMLLSSLDTTIVSTAMPKISATLGGVEYLSWTFTAYMLASTISVPIFGKLADIYGRKYFYVLGILLFLLGSALCGAAQSMTQLILFRGLQGIGGGIMMSNSMAIVSDIFPPAERGKFQGIIGGVFGLASVIGPALGGFITDNLNWRWVFYVNLPVGILAVIVLWMAIPPMKKNSEKRSIDYSGAAFIIIAFTPLLLALSWAGSKYAWASREIIGLLAFSFVALIILGIIELKVKDPIIPLSFFKNSIFSVGVLSSFLMSVALFGTVMYIPLFVQGVIGATATSSGAITTPMMLSLVVASAISGQLISRLGKYKLLAIAGFTVMLAGMILLSLMGVDTTNATVVRNMIVVGTGVGLVMPIFIIAVQNAFPHSQVGTVTASVQFFRNIGSTTGVAILGSLLNSRFKAESERLIPEAIKKLLPAGKQNIFDTPQTLFDPQFIEQIKSKVPAKVVGMFTKLFSDLKGALATSIHDVFFAGILVIAAALVLVFFLKEIPLRKGHKPAPEEIGQEYLAEGLTTDGHMLTPESEPDLTEADE